MSSANPFDLLVDDDNDDPSRLIALQQHKLSVKKPAASASGSPVPPAKLPSKPLPPTQAVRESRNINTAAVRSGAARGGVGRGGSGGGTGFVENRDLGNRAANGYSGGELEDGDIGRTSERGRGSYGPPRELFRGGRNGGSGNGDVEEGKSDPDRTHKRVYERKSGTGRGLGMKRDGAGRGNWGTIADDYLPQETEEIVNKENAVIFEKTEGKANNASSDKKDDAVKRGGEEEPEDKEMTLEEYEIVKEERRSALLSMKAEERRVVFDKDFEAMHIPEPSSSRYCFLSHAKLRLPSDLSMALEIDEAREGRSQMVKRFFENSFEGCSLAVPEFQTIEAKYVPTGFTARLPARTAKINETARGELAIATAHFEAGLRLPLWPEICQVLRYYGVILAQMTPNAVADMVGFACYLRSERIEFDLSVFRKVFSFRPYKDGTVYFMSSHVKLVGTVNKSHRWTRKFIRVKGPFDDVPYAPVQLDESSYKPPQLGGRSVGLYKALQNQIFDVVHLRRHVDSLAPVPFRQGEREVPINPPCPKGTHVLSPANLPETAAVALRASEGGSAPSSSRKRKVPSTSTTAGGASTSGGSLAGREAPVDLTTGEEGGSPLPSTLPPSDQHAPNGHRNFPLGEFSKDELGCPLLQWDRKSNHARISTLLPSWVESDELGAEPYHFSFGLYGREDACEVDSLLPRELVFESARAQLRALELAHMEGQRLIRADKENAELKKERDAQQEEITALKDELKLAEAKIASMEGNLDSETAKQLINRNADLEEENESLRRKLVEKRSFLASPSPFRAGAALAAGREFDLLIQKNAIAAAENLFEVLQDAGLLTAEAAGLTARDIIPSIYEPVPDEPETSGTNGARED